MAAGIAAGRKENVLISSGDCSVTVLSTFGGKVAGLLAEREWGVWPMQVDRGVL
jgi:hypothetical protein